ncbi:MAG TPA: TetR/AcrR family transcriptional regulator [Nitrospira sp.]|nr:TetR/AcrR family transcriptional regulator [Nitrospira sp.]
MARRSDHSRQELCGLALAAARRVVEKEGLQGLTARSVADEIGYSPGTLYNLFENLDDLIVNMNGQTLDDLYEQLSSTPSSGQPMIDLRRLLDRYLAFLEAYPNRWKAFFEFNLAEGRQLPDWYVAKVSKVLGLLEHALSPLFAPEDDDGKRNMARVLWASLHGICSLSDTGKLRVVTTQSVREMAEALVTHFVAGLAAQR